MRVIYVLSALVFLTPGCKQSEPEREEEVVTCLMDKATYSDGSYTRYKFDAKGSLTETTTTYFDENGKIVEVPITYEYNAAGNLSKTYSPGGWVDEYTYDATGALTQVVFKDPNGQAEDQFKVTTDGQKRIVKIVDIYNSAATYTYDSHGNVTKTEVIWNGIVLDRATYEYDNSSKTKSGVVSVKGHPFSPVYMTSQIIYYPPLNLVGRDRVPVKAKFETRWNEDYSDFGNMRTYSEYTGTYKTNNNNFITEANINETVLKVTFIHKYSYSNCN